jgi:hypothetical protein
MISEIQELPKLTEDDHVSPLEKMIMISVSGLNNTNAAMVAAMDLNELASDIIRKKDND